MDGELVSEPSEEDALTVNSTESLSDIFRKLFPRYLAMGMTYDQYWNDDAQLVKYYREADKIRAERDNYGYWLQGMYIYEALCDASPIFRSFSKKGTKPTPYRDQPYPIFQEQKKKQDEAKAKAISDKGLRMFEALMKNKT